MRLKSAIITFGCAAVLSIAALAQRGPGGPGGPQGPSPEERERIRTVVGMSREQQAQIEAIYAEGHRQESESRKKSGELMKQLGALYDTYDYDRGQANAIRKEVCELYKQRMRIHAETQDKVRKVLTKDQFDKLTALAKERFEKMRKEWQQRRGGPGPGGPPPGFGRAPGG